MTVYAYTGVNEKGRTVRGTIDADSVRGARQVLRRQGVFLDDAKPLDEGRAKKAIASAASAARGNANATATAIALAGEPRAFEGVRRVFGTMRRAVSSSVKSVSLSTRQLATLLKAGIALPEALGAMTEQIDEKDLREAFEQIAERVREGIAFARALEEHPHFFPPLYVNMVAAGEVSGNLEGVLARLADFTEAQVKLKNKVQGALAYPLFMFVFGSLLVGVMIVGVVPKVASIFEDFRTALPWYTALLIWISHALGTFWWVLLLAIGGAFFALQRWRSTPEGAFKWDAFVLTVPIFGEIARMVAVARFTRTLATLLASGVPLLKAMEIVKNVLGNRVLETVVTEATSSIREGESIAEPLKRSGKFPPMVTHMIAIGERSGDLEGMLESVANSYDQTIDARVGVLTSLLEPMLIAMMGGASASIAFAILMPLLQLNDFAQ